MITIIGGAGLVGASLQRKLESEGYEVAALDRGRLDLNKQDTFEAIPSNTRILVHAAGIVGSSAPDLVTWQTNLHSTYYLTRFLNKERRIDFMLYVSTGAVYASSEEPILAGAPENPGSLYGMTKLLSEKTLDMLLQVQVAHARIFFPIGPGQRLPRLLPGLIKRIMANETVELDTEEGLPMINPIIVDELAEQLFNILKSDGSRKRIYNLGGSVRLSIRQLAEKVAQALDVKPVFNVSNRGGKSLFCQPDFPSSTGESFDRSFRDIVTSIASRLQ